MSSAKLWDFHGGIHPPERKALSNRLPTQLAPLPAQLILPLAPPIGAPAEAIVAVGERVLKGQPIAAAGGRIGTPLHAPTSGTVSFIGLQPYPHASGLPVTAIVIDSDGLDEWTTLEPCSDYRRLEPSVLLEKIRQAGIGGLGGAGFPTAAKLLARPPEKIHTLIINGAECEPYITADDRLMRERASELVAGIEILAWLLQPEQVLIGIEDNKPEAIAAMRAALGECPFGLRVLPTKYPSGGEKQLVELLTGQQVPSGGLPADIGILCQNVGTCVAIHDAVLLGRPLISRIVTLTGEALARPMNVEALLGTPVGELLAFAGLDRARMDRLIMGGPMMGFTLASLDVPLIKTGNCLLAPTRSELPPPPPALPCIRCGTCADACPASLLPQQLHFFALGQEHEQLRAHNLFDCIECGACAYVCPSSLPLVQYYRAAKAEIRELEQKRHKAEHSRRRFELRQERLRKAEEHKEAERKARAEQAAQAKATTGESAAAPKPSPQTAALAEQQKKLKIEASMAQVALKKAEKQLAAQTTPELEAQVAELRANVEAAQKALAELTVIAPPVPPAHDEALKKAKIELAMKRAELKKAEKAGAEETELQRLREALAAAEQALHAAEDASGKPAPELVRTNKRPVDERLRTLKTELAFARADLRKLERDASTDPPVLESARARLSEAERLLAEHQSE